VSMIHRLTPGLAPVFGSHGIIRVTGTGHAGGKVWPDRHDPMLVDTVTRDEFQP
jgi:hypothetical protein